MEHKTEGRPSTFDAWKDEIAASTQAVRLAVMAGPTCMSMAMLPVMCKRGENSCRYDLRMADTASEAAELLRSGEVDAATLPCVQAAKLYAAEPDIMAAAICAVNTVLVLERGNRVGAIDDLKGRTVHAIGQHATPQFLLHDLMGARDLSTDRDCKVIYHREAGEVFALGKEADLFVLPQPFAFMMLHRDNTLRPALDLTEMWRAAQVPPAVEPITGILVVRKAYLRQNTETFVRLLDDCRTSAEQVDENPALAAGWMEDYGLTGAAAEAAVERSGITFVEGEEMRKRVGEYLKMVHRRDAELLDGVLPDDAFYFKR